MIFEIFYLSNEISYQQTNNKNIGLHDDETLLSKMTPNSQIILFNSSQKLKDKMPVRPIIRMGNPILRIVAEKVDPSQIASEKIQSLIQDLQDTMIPANGLGIAAPQIGVSLQVCIIEVPQFNPRYGKLTPFPRSVLINPVITPLTNQTQGFWEGCLSVPGIRGFVERPRKIKAQYYDQQGNHKEVIIQGFGAVVFQHETDHLNGTLFVDKISNKKIAFIEEFNQFGLYNTQKVLDD